jgi:ribosomal protein L37AE/L43A
MGIMSVKMCPKCESEDVQMMAGGTTGTWMCKKCGFYGSIFPEKEILGKEIEEEEKEKKG